MQSQLLDASILLNLHYGPTSTCQLMTAFLRNPVAESNLNPTCALPLPVTLGVRFRTTTTATSSGRLFLRRVRKPHRLHLGGMQRQRGAMVDRRTVVRVVRIEFGGRGRGTPAAAGGAPTAAASGCPGRVQFWVDGRDVAFSAVRGRSIIHTYLAI